MQGEQRPVPAIETHITGADGRSGPPPRERRLDARRNLESIIDAARRTFAENPRASMQQVAAAAHLHRATVHRHFASRDDLLNALQVRAMDEAVAALRDANLDDGPAADALRRATRAFMELAERWQITRYAAVQQEGPAVEEVGRIMGRLIARGQREGVVRDDLDADVLTTIWGGIFSNAALFLQRGMSVDEASEAISTVLLAPGAQRGRSSHKR
jgi:AcrR family transcriptional regulator